ncbi:isoprenylcysteine carboxylmethyltransferase family protein [Microbacterium deminutum]|uniref:Phosphatidylethanolamine N-methyltransferase family protein n=1 Tax=Microbacterium deminutum TaxID=344164 RepID=A0ABP5CS29_9MICO
MLGSVAAGRRRQIGWLLAGYGGLAGFLALEALRGSGGAASLTASEDDQGTTRMIATAYGLAISAPILARPLPTRPLPPPVAAVGLVLQATGLGVRAWSMRTLGRSYSRTLRTEDDRQAVVETGPYRWIRHPGYLGSLLTWVGFALASRSLPVAILVPSLLAAVYVRRMQAEEQFLRRDLPGYIPYTSRTWKLLPFVW